MVRDEIPVYVHVRHFHKIGGVVKIKEGDKLSKLGDCGWEGKFTFGADNVMLRRQEPPFSLLYKKKTDEATCDEEGNAVRNVTYYLEDKFK